MRVPVCMGRYIQTREALSSLGRKFDRSQAGGVCAAYIFTLRLTGSKLPVPGEPCRRVADVAHPTHRRGENDAASPIFRQFHRDDTQPTRPGHARIRKALASSNDGKKAMSHLTSLVRLLVLSSALVPVTALQAQAAAQPEQGEEAAEASGTQRASS